MDWKASYLSNKSTEILIEDKNEVVRLLRNIKHLVCQDAWESMLDKLEIQNIDRITEHKCYNPSFGSLSTLTYNDLQAVKVVIQLLPNSAKPESYFPEEKEGEYEQSVSLTEREADVFRWLKTGKNNSEVAMILAISEATVKFHLKNIYKKLGVTTRVQAVQARIDEKAG